jgi:hypothetical protein
MGVRWVCGQELAVRMTVTMRMTDRLPNYISPAMEHMNFFEVLVFIQVDKPIRAQD